MYTDFFVDDNFDPDSNHSDYTLGFPSDTYDLLIIGSENKETIKDKRLIKEVSFRINDTDYRGCEFSIAHFINDPTIAANGKPRFQLAGEALARIYWRATGVKLTNALKHRFDDDIMGKIIRLRVEVSANKKHANLRFFDSTPSHIPVTMPVSTPSQNTGGYQQGGYPQNNYPTWQSWQNK